MAASDGNGTIFGFEIQHIFPNEILSGQSLEAQQARALLASIGFNLEA
jgi:hypothetical protein